VECIWLGTINVHVAGIAMVFLSNPHHITVDINKIIKIIFLSIDNSCGSFCFIQKMIRELDLLYWQYC